MNALEPAADAAALDALLDTLRESAVRDLAWLLFSPHLLRAQPPRGELATVFETADEAAATSAWLHELERDVAPLHEAIAVLRVVRLGRYAECLLAHFLRYGPAVRLVAANVALRRAGRTLGECDFLVETASGRRLHWELAVKCYLHVGSAQATLADYVGPNLQDRFDLKLAHLLDHQLPLSARDEFATLGHVGPWDAQMLVKGWLFYRWDPVRNGLTAAPAETTEVDIAGPIDPAHARGFWTTHEQWPRLAAAHPACRWVVLPRLAWLAPRRDVEAGSADEAMLGDVATLAERLTQQASPTMVAGFVNEGGGRWCERLRGFVVPDAWPAQAQAFAAG
ncbi:DUF1853 family protein [Trinickia fusca]|uniref:DUF1853 family protein n=1 Tax=Trinickia fusca TaxID=2419777 RepID=A0A494XSE0_9BURK|nr:DUF1853 family protein [Trinickia fusca]RKP52732.1 DUF1853 family protein [Trinickia fusca]